MPPAPQPRPRKPSATTGTGRSPSSGNAVLLPATVTALAAAFLVGKMVKGRAAAALSEEEREQRRLKRLARFDAASSEADQQQQVDLHRPGLNAVGANANENNIPNESSVPAAPLPSNEPEDDSGNQGQVNERTVDDSAEIVRVSTAPASQDPPSSEPAAST